MSVREPARPDRLRMRVWERGTGVTLASGSSACAVAVACARAGWTGRAVTVAVDGGEFADRLARHRVWMTGPTAEVFTGTLSADFLEGLVWTARRSSRHFGCRLNAYETEAMKRLPPRAGVEDAVVVNTCAVTAEAVRKARQDIRKLRRANRGRASW
jgi:hypothetical protein